MNDTAAATTSISVLIVVFIIGIVTGFLLSFSRMRSWLGGWGGAVSGKFQQARHLISTGEEVKMMLVVRKDLKMGTGKIAAQCAHAAVAVAEEVQACRHLTDNSGAVVGGTHTWVEWYDAWRLTGSAKVAVQCPDEVALMTVAREAKAAGLPFYVIRDAGRTQIAAGSRTVVAVGPAPKSVVDTVTGHLKLL